MMFIRLSVCLSGTGMYCDRMVRASEYLSLWLQSMSTYLALSFSSSTWKRGGVGMCKLGMVSQEQLKINVKLLFSANKKPYMPRRLAQQRMT